MGQAASTVHEEYFGQTSKRFDGERPEPLALSVIIPALDEAANISAALNSARSGLVPPLEILVVDGGSNDDTVAQAQRLGAQVISSPRGRGRQLNAGWRAARGDWCLFLHSDSRLPPQYDRLIAEALRAAAVRQQRPRCGGWATHWTDSARRAVVTLGDNACRPPCHPAGRASPLSWPPGGLAASPKASEGVPICAQGNKAAAAPCVSASSPASPVSPIEANGGELGRTHPPLASGPAWAVADGGGGGDWGWGCSTADGMGGGCSTCCGPAGPDGGGSCGTSLCGNAAKQCARGGLEWPSTRLWAAPGCCAATSAATADAAAAAWASAAGAAAVLGPAGWHSGRRGRGRAGDRTAASSSHPSEDKAAAVDAAAGARGAASGSATDEDGGSGPVCSLGCGPGRCAVALSGPTWGAFATIETDLQNPILRTLLSMGVGLRTRWLHRPYGDQALFVRRDILEACGGFVEWPLLEDLEMVVRLGKNHSPAIVDAPIRTSGRRWKAVGFLRTTLLNQVILAGYVLGVSPDTLARWYTSAKRAMA